MSFFKRLFGPRPDATPAGQAGPAPATPATAMPEGVKQLLFNMFGSQVYDDMVWLGQHLPEQARPVFRGLEYIEQAVQQLVPLVPEAPALVARYVGPSVTGLRQALVSHPEIASRFFLNSVEFQARVEHAVGTLQGGGVKDGGGLMEWLVQEQASQAASSAQATFFNAPMSLFLAHDSEWMSTDNSPRTRIVLWGTLSTASVFAAHLLHHLKRKFDLPSAETQGSVYAHLRVAWLAYIAQILDEDRSPSERAVRHYFGLLTGDPQVLDIYGLHMMEVFRRLLYRQGTNADIYEHFASLLLPYAPQVRSLDEINAQAFFEDSHLLPLIAAETQWLKKPCKPTSLKAMQPVCARTWRAGCSR